MSVILGVGPAAALTLPRPSRPPWWGRGPRSGGIAEPGAGGAPGPPRQPCSVGSGPSLMAPSGGAASQSPAKAGFPRAGPAKVVQHVGLAQSLELLAGWGPLGSPNTPCVLAFGEKPSLAKRGLSFCPKPGGSPASSAKATREELSCWAEGSVQGCGGRGARGLSQTNR